MKKIFTCLLLVVFLTGPSRICAQTLEFSKDGSLRNNDLPPFYKSGSTSYVWVCLYDVQSQPKSKYQGLIDTYSPGLMSPLSDPGQNALNFPYRANTVDFAFNSDASTHEVKLNLDKSGEFVVNIAKPNIDNMLFKKHFDNKKVRNHYHDFVRYLPMYDSLRAIYDSHAGHIERLALQDTLFRSTANTIELGLQLDSIQDAQYYLIELTDKIKDENKDWLEDWKWLTKGEKLLNPFYPNADFLAERLNVGLSTQRLILRVFEEKLNFFVAGSSEYNNAKLEAKTIQKSLSLLEQQEVKIAEFRKSGGKWLSSVVPQEENLTDFRFFVSEPAATDPITWMHHKNALYNYVSLNKSPFPGSVFEGDRVMAYVHNLKPDQKVKAAEKVDSIAPQTSAEKALNDPFEALSRARSGSASILSLLGGLKSTVFSLVGSSVGDKSTGEDLVQPDVTFQKENFLDNTETKLVLPVYDPAKHGYIYGNELNFLLNERKLFQNLRGEMIDKLAKSITTKSPLLDGLTSPDVETLKQIEFFINQIELRIVALLDVQVRLDLYVKNRQHVKWLSLQTPPPFAAIEMAYNNAEKQKANFRSENVLTGESRSAKGNNRISYSLTEEGKSVIVAKDEYVTYKTVRFWPAVGINYVLGSRTTSIFDDSTKSFKANTNIDNFEAVVGVKMYWRKSNLTRTVATKDLISAIGKDNKGRGNSFSSGTFGYFGLGVSHNFLKNYFLGLGHDVVPGISVQGGVNLYFRKGYDLQNGQIRRDFDFPVLRVYFGISMDPTVVTKLIQLF